MRRSGLWFVKTLIKSSLDNYVLPGTLTGTEILLLYMTHWKRNLHLFVSGALYLISSHLLFSAAEENVSADATLAECTVQSGDPTETA